MPADVTKERDARYRAELRAARRDARITARQLDRALRQRRCPLRDLACVAERAKLAAARLYTAAACLLSPP